MSSKYTLEKKREVYGAVKNWFEKHSDNAEEVPQ
jgi:hypothetical protein